jgi:hypothetical protein
MVGPVSLIQTFGNLLEQPPLPPIDTAQEFSQFAIARAVKNDVRVTRPAQGTEDDFSTDQTLNDLRSGKCGSNRRYAIRIGIARGHWRLAIYLPDKELPEERTVIGKRQDAEIAARAIIDEMQVQFACVVSHRV